MKRSGFLTILVVGMLTVWGTVSAKKQQEMRLDGRPNIVVFMVADLGWQHTSEPFWRDTSYWNKIYRTPNMQRLAERGVKFTSAYAASLNDPTWASLLTGMNPARHRVTNNLSLTAGRMIDPENLRLDWPVWSLNGIASEPGKLHTTYATTFVDILQRAGYRVARETDELSAIVSETDGASPFLFLLKYSDLQKAGDLPDYKSKLSEMDDALGTLMDALEEKGIADNTILIFMSDSGGVIRDWDDEKIIPQNFPLRGGKGSAYEGGIRIPLIISWPGVADTARTVHSMVAVQDLMPTILDMGNVKKRKTLQKIDGETLIPLLTGNERMRYGNPLVWHQPNMWDQQGDGAGPYSAIRMGPWKLIYWYETETVSMFNLRDDIFEKIDHGENLVDARRQERMLKRLTKQLQRMDAQVPRLKIQGTFCNYPDGSAYRLPKWERKGKVNGMYY